MATVELVNLDDDGSITVGLDDYDEEAGEVRTTGVADGNRQQKHGYSVRYSVLMQCHGSWQKNTGSTNDTTLVVVKIQPVIADGRNDWFKTLKVTLEVADDRDSSGSIVKLPKVYEEPYVDSYAPAQYDPVAAAEAKLPTEAVNTASASLQGGAPSGFLSVSLAGSRQKKVAYDSLKHLKVSSDTCRGVDSGKYDAAVKWTVAAIDQSLGTGNSITVALLVRRSPGCTFAVLADTKGDLDPISSTKDWLAKKKTVCIPGFGTADSIANQYTAMAAAVTIDRNNMHTLGQSRGNGTALDALVGGSGIHLTQVVEPAVSQAATGTLPPADAASGPASYPGRASGQRLWNARARRHRNMAVLYENLAKLHREEAGEAYALADVSYEQYVDGLLE